MSQFESPIMPTVGRVVLVRGIAISLTEPKRQYPALVTGVCDQNTIDLVTFNEQGTLYINHATYDDSDGETAVAWSWMDYQKKVAAEQAETVEATGASDSYREDNRRRDALSYATEVVGGSKDAHAVMVAAKEFLSFLEGDKPTELTSQTKVLVEESTPYTRVVKEYNELHARIASLTAFLPTKGFDQLPIGHQVLLHSQLKAMRLYEENLLKRIDLFEMDS